MNSNSSYTKLSKHLKHQKCHFHRNIYLLASIFILSNSSTIPFAACFKNALYYFSARIKRLWSRTYFIVHQKIFFSEIKTTEIQKTLRVISLHCFSLLFSFSLTPAKTFWQRSAAPSSQPFALSLSEVCWEYFLLPYFSLSQQSTLLKHQNNCNVQKCRKRGEKQQKYQMHINTQVISRVPQQDGITKDIRWAAQVLSVSVCPR